MTTNKLEIKIHGPSRNTGPDRNVRPSDYEALQADRDALAEALEAVIDYLPIGSPARGLGLSTLAAHRKGAAQ